MTRSLSPCPVLTVMCLLLPVLKTEKLRVSPKVWGYVGQEEVILPCQTVPCPSNCSVSLVQWDKTVTKSSEGYKRLVVHLAGSGLTNISRKDKIDLKKYSLVIKNVDLEDAGVYSCSMSVFPYGAFYYETTLLIRDQMPLSAGVVSAIVISVLLLLAIIAASVYFIVIRRCPPSSRNHITIDTDGWDPYRTSFIKREDVVYADAAILQASNPNRVSSSEDHVTYSEVRVNRRRPETVYSQVMNI